MKNKNIEYCVYCGIQNKPDDKKCIKCHKKLNPKNTPLLDYLKSKLKDDLKGSLEDNIFSIIINYIKSHLYGFILTCSIIITTTCIITNIIDNDHIQHVTEKPSLVMSTINTCIFDNSLLPINLCNEGYNLEDGTCKKEEKQEATINNICPNGYSLNGNSCISNLTYNTLTKEECLLPDDGALSVSVAETGECVATYCIEWNGEECTAGSGEPIDYTITEYCPDGTSMINGACRSTSNIITEYSCEEGELNEDKCIITFTQEPYLSCEEGYTLNEECELCVLEEES